MGKVIAFASLAKRKAAQTETEASQQEGQGRGCISFTDTGNGVTHMELTGTYANHLQFGLYAMVTGLKDLVDRVVASGEVGHHSSGPIHEALTVGRRPPGRKRQWPEPDGPRAQKSRPKAAIPDDTSRLD